MRMFFMLTILGFGFFLSTFIGSHNMGVLNPKGVVALAEKNLLITAFLLMLIVIVPVFVMLFSFAWRYRASNTKAKYTPDWHSNRALEIVWWTIPAIIIFILALLTWKSTHDLDPFKPLASNVKPITIQVVALDWKWLFIYPDEHIATVNYVEFPKDTPVLFKITSDAPMNAFWIPQLGGQVYAMPGMTAQLNLMATEKGVYKGLSTNFSGEGFSGMKFEVHVTEENEYQSWLYTVRGSPYVLDITRYTELAKQSKNNAVEYFALTDDDLFGRILMKFMAPMEGVDHHIMSEGMDPLMRSDTYPPTHNDILMNEKALSH